MPKVQFIKPWTVQQGDGKGPVYSVGDVVELERSYADKYKRRGLAVDHVEAAPAPELLPLNPKSSDADPPAGTVEIPDEWRDLPWPSLKSLAARVTAEPVHNKADATAAIELEVERRAEVAAAAAAGGVEAE